MAVFEFFVGVFIGIVNILVGHFSGSINKDFKFHKFREILQKSIQGQIILTRKTQRSSLRKSDRAFASKNKFRYIIENYLKVKTEDDNPREFDQVWCKCQKCQL